MTAKVNVLRGMMDRVTHLNCEMAQAQEARDKMADNLIAALNEAILETSTREEIGKILVDADMMTSRIRWFFDQITRPQEAIGRYGLLDLMHAISAELHQEKHCIL